MGKIEDTLAEIRDTDGRIKLYAKAEDAWIAGAEERLEREIPSVYKDFITRHHNGLWLFGGALSFSGVRPTTTDVDHPYDLEDPNKYDARATDPPEDYFFFGSFDVDGSELALDGDGHVHHVDRDSLEIRESWDSFADAFAASWARVRDEES